MNAIENLSPIGHPMPELPVADVERAQQHYRDALGFEIGWLYPGKEMGAASRQGVAIFFRKKEPPFEPAVHWVFADDINASYEELKSLGANIVEPLERNRGGYASSPSWTWTGTCFTSITTNAIIKSCDDLRARGPWRLHRAYSMSDPAGMPVAMRVISTRPDCSRSMSAR